MILHNNFISADSLKKNIVERVRMGGKKNLTQSAFKESTNTSLSNRKSTLDKRHSMSRILKTNQFSESYCKTSNTSSKKKLRISCKLDRTPNSSSLNKFLYAPAKTIASMKQTIDTNEVQKQHKRSSN